VVFNDAAEDRLRELLRDPGWSLPAWPDAQARVRTVARRQRIRLAAAAIGTTAAVAVIFASVTGFSSAPAVGPGQPGKTLAAFTLPAVGARGFPAGIYPLAESAVVTGLVSHCPDPAGLAPAGSAVRARTIAVVDDLGQSFRSDLRLSDRAYWPQAQAGWRAGTAGASGARQVLYSGPLETRHPESGTPDLGRSVRTACGNRIARDSWLIVTGQADEPGQRSEFLLLDRRGHVLLWNAQAAGD
jgi:hypothetical protein